MKITLALESGRPFKVSDTIGISRVVEQKNQHIIKTDYYIIDKVVRVTKDSVTYEVRLLFKNNKAVKDDRIKLKKRKNERAKT